MIFLTNSSIWGLYSDGTSKSYRLLLSVVLFFIIEVASTILVSLIGAVLAIKLCLYSLKCLLVLFTTNKGTVLFLLKHKTVLITFNPGSFAMKPLSVSETS